MKANIFILYTLLFVHFLSYSQNLTARIIDAVNNKPLPYANIKVNGEMDLISNEEGYFNLSVKDLTELSTIKVSFIGYISRHLTLAELKEQNLTVSLTSASFELDNISISNKKPDPNQIIAETSKRLNVNYKPSDKSSKNKFFFRESSVFKPSTLDLNIEKSTGFTKNQLKEANKDLTAFSNGLINKPAQEFKDILGNYYTGKKLTKENKLIFFPKLDVIKATNIKGDGTSTSLDDMEEIGTKILLKHLDSTKFYRIKSGLFGSRDTITLNKNYHKKKKNKPVSKLISTKNNIMMFMAKQRFSNDKLDFITNSRLYSYQLVETVFNDESNELVYVIKFRPKKNKGIYTGTLYINESDYAVVKCHYQLAEGKKTGGFNLKLLLGIKTFDNLSKGTIIFQKNHNDKNYNLQYAYEESGVYFYVNRPLKFIELTKEDKDVVALDLIVEGNSIAKKELLAISKTEISDNDFETFKESDFNYIQLKRYDASVWQEYFSIEPLQTMKEYRVAND